MVEEKYLSITSEGFSEEGYGNFDPRTMTAVLTTPCDKVIRIESDNITLTSNGTLLDNTAHTGIYISNVNNITIKRLDLRNQKIGIYCNESEGVRIIGVNFEACIYGISAEYCSNIVVEECYFFDMRQIGVSGFANWNVSLANNHFERMQQGIGLDGCHDIEVSNCVVRSCKRAGILISNGRDISVYKNSIRHGNEGIIVKNCEEEVSIRLNHITNLNECGIYIYNIKDFRIENNRIENIQLHGMIINVGTNGVLVNNRIIGSAVGVSLEYMSVENIIRKNRIVDCRFRCIEEYSDGNLIESNNILECV